MGTPQDPKIKQPQDPKIKQQRECHSKKRRESHIDSDKDAVERLRALIKEESGGQRRPPPPPPSAPALPAFDKEALARLAEQAKQLKDAEDESHGKQGQENGDGPSVSPVALSSASPRTVDMHVEKSALGRMEPESNAQTVQNFATPAAAAAAAALAQVAVAAQVRAKDSSAAVATVSAELKASKPLKGGPNCMGPTYGIKKKNTDASGTSSNSVTASLPTRGSSFGLAIGRPQQKLFIGSIITGAGGSGASSSTAGGSGGRSNTKGSEDQSKLGVEDATPAASAAVAALAQAAAAAQVRAKDSSDAAAKATTASSNVKPLKGGPNCTGPTYGIRKKGTGAASIATDSTASATVVPQASAVGSAAAVSSGRPQATLRIGSVVGGAVSASASSVGAGSGSSSARASDDRNGVGFSSPLRDVSKQVTQVSEEGTAKSQSKGNRDRRTASSDASRGASSSENRRRRVNSRKRRHRSDGKHGQHRSADRKKHRGSRSRSARRR